MSDPKPQERDRSCGFFVDAEEVAFRPLRLDDLDRVMAIERSSFEFPWSQRFFVQELQVSCARALVALIEGKIVGYILFWLLPESIDVHNVAVEGPYRRRGIGRRLLHQVIGEARRRGVSRVTLEVRRSNLPAQKLYRSLGFVQTGIRKAYYSDNGEDAFAMTLSVTD